MDGEEIGEGYRKKDEEGEKRYVDRERNGWIE